MDRLSIFLTLMTGSVLTGSFVITAFTLEYYTWPAILISAALGFGLAWPAGYLVSRKIKRDDAAWDASGIERTDGIVPDPKAPEV